MFQQMNNLQQRLVVGSVSTAFMLLAIYLSHTPAFSLIFVLLIAAIICLALWEYYHIAQLKQLQPLSKIGLIGTVAYALATFLTTQFEQVQILPHVVFGLTFSAAFLYYFIKGSDPFINMAITFFGFIYLTIPLSFLILINYFRIEPTILDGRWSLFYLLTVTKMTDTGAFFIGKRFGQTKLCPLISPKKTWEGAVGGLLSSILASIILYGIFQSAFQKNPFAISFWQSIWLGILISVTAQFGDLAESLLKRNMGVKDSSHLPGLGGVLDIVDSIVFTAPLMYLFLKLIPYHSL